MANPSRGPPPIPGSAPIRDPQQVQHQQAVQAAQQNQLEQQRQMLARQAAAAQQTAPPAAGAAPGGQAMTAAQQAQAIALQKQKIVQQLQALSKPEKFVRIAPYFKCVEKNGAEECPCIGWKATRAPAGPTPVQPEPCTRCQHALTSHGDLNAAAIAELDRRLIVVYNIERLWQNMNNAKTPQEQRPMYLAKISELKAQLYRANPVVPAPRAPANGQQQGIQNELQASRDAETIRRQHQMIAKEQKFAAVIGNPPFEQPTCSQILRNFLELKYLNQPSLAPVRLHNFEKLCKTFLTAVNRQDLPEPDKHMQKNPTDQSYQLNYQRWRYFCSPAGKFQYKPGDIFGRQFLLSVFKLALESVLTNFLLPADMKPLVPTFFNDLEQEIINSASIIFAADFQTQLVSHRAADRHGQSDQMKGRKRMGEALDAPPAKRARTDSSIISVPSIVPPIPRVEAPKNISLKTVFGESIQTFGTGVLGPGTGFGQQISRDELAKQEEEEGALSFVPVINDGTPGSHVILVKLKALFSAQLPKMPRDYIMRMVLDRKHRAVALCKSGKVKGGILYRPFREQGFAEIVFCAIDRTEQIKGYGTHLMNHLKEEAKKQQIYNFLTYADNFAIGYFKKQGFNREITLPLERWTGFIKDYEGANLMECRFNPAVDYLSIPVMVQKQRNKVNDAIKIKSKTNGRVFDGLTEFRRADVKRIEIPRIPGVLDAGWQPGGEKTMSQAKMLSSMRELVEQMRDHPKAWPFTEPVSRTDVPDYYVIIKHPMDLQTVANNLEDGKYRTVAIFKTDCMRIFSNAREYNDPPTEYYKCANEMENFFLERMHHYGLEESGR